MIKNGREFKAIINQLHLRINVEVKPMSIYEALSLAVMVYTAYIT